MLGAVDVVTFVLWPGKAIACCLLIFVFCSDMDYATFRPILTIFNYFVLIFTLLCFWYIRAIPLYTVFVNLHLGSAVVNRFIFITTIAMQFFLFHFKRNLLFSRGNSQLLIPYVFNLLFDLFWIEKENPYLKRLLFVNVWLAMRKYCLHHLLGCLTSFKFGLNDL